MGKVVSGLHRHNGKRRLNFVEFLSEEWYVAANKALRRLEIGAIDVVVAHVSEVRSHYIILEGGKASVTPETKIADVTLRQTSDSAQAVREGSLSALTAIQEGLITVEGDIGRLIAAKDALEAVDKALSGLAP